MSTDEVRRAAPVSYDDRLAIATPEGVEVELTLADIGSRFIAGGIDFTIQLAVIISLALILRPAGDAGAAVFTSAMFALIFFYDVLFEVLGGGRTPGKRWTGLRVVRSRRAADHARAQLRAQHPADHRHPARLLRGRHDGDLHHAAQPADRRPRGGQPRRPHPPRRPAAARAEALATSTPVRRHLGRDRRVAGRRGRRARVPRAPPRAPGASTATRSRASWPRACDRASAGRRRTSATSTFLELLVAAKTASRR